MPDAPSAWKIEKALAAWNELKSECLGDDLGEWEAALYRKGGDVKDIVRSLAIAATHDASRAEVCKTTMDNASVRKKRFEAREARKREIILQLMDILGMKSEDFGDVSVSMIPGVSSVVITDEAALPAEYVIEKTVRTPDKRAIKADLEQGVVIEGACLSNAVPFITIRTK